MVSVVGCLIIVERKKNVKILECMNQQTTIHTCILPGSNGKLYLQKELSFTVAWMNVFDVGSVVYTISVIVDGGEIGCIKLYQ